MSKARNEETKEFTYYEQHDIPTASVSEIKKQLRTTWEHKQFRGAYCIVGEAGMGKSQIVHQLAEDVNAEICDIRTAQFGLMGTGVPSTTGAKSNDHFKIKLPGIFPKEGDRAIILFDEINQGQPHAIAMFFSMIEDRRMFDYVLPEDVMVVALMNPATANYAVTTIENNAALRRRLKFVYAIPSFSDWIKHAKTERFHSTAVDLACLGEAKACHPEVLKYFQNNATAIDDKKARIQNKQYTCPATIQTISLDAYVLDKEKEALYGETAKIRFASSIGNTAATALCAYIQDNSIMIDPLQLLTNYKAVKSRVTKLVKNDKIEILSELNVNVLSVLFSEKPAIKKVAKNLVTFLSSMPNDIVGSVLMTMEAVADENGAQQYLDDLMYFMQDLDGWMDLNNRQDSSHKKIANALNQ